MSPDVISGGQLADEDRYSSIMNGYRQPVDPTSSGPIDGDYHDQHRLPSLELSAPEEPDLEVSWLDSPTATMADHPLLRGLLMELPSRGNPPAPEWLERWFEATRSILELLYGSDQH
mgnify:CR=1 FL=1